MDGSGGPQRANAAQLAARNIKSIRPNRKGARATPMRADSATQFAPPQQQGAQGGLFGGGVQGAGSFNFTSSGPSFPPPSFGGGNLNNPFGMSNGSSPEPSDNDDRRDPNEERASKKRLGSFGGLQQANSLFQSSTSFGQNPMQQPTQNMFGGLQNGGGFSFNSPSQAPMTGFAQAPAVEKAPTSIFSFGNTVSQPAASIQSINFGATQEKQGNNMFGSQALMQGSGFNFMSTAPTEKPQSNPFSFTQPPSQPASTTFSFGSAPATSAPASNLFGGSQPAPSNMFSSATPTSALVNPFASLNSKPSLAAPTTNLFGSREPSPAPPAATSSLFGNREINPTPPAPTNNIFFGNREKSATPTSASNIFGNKEQESKASTTHSATTVQQATPKINNLFGGSSQAASTPTLFGAQKSLPSGNLFGPSSAGNTPIAGNNTPTSSSNIFGGLPKQAQVAKTLFGATNEQVAEPSKVHSTKATDIPATGSASQAQRTSLLDTNPIAKPAAGGSSSLFSASSGVGLSSPSKSTQSLSPSQPSVPQPNISKNVVAPSKPIEAPKTGSLTTTNGTNPTPQQPSSRLTTHQEPLVTASAPKSDRPPGPAALRNLKDGHPATSEKKVETQHKRKHREVKEVENVLDITEEDLDYWIPKHYNEDERKDFLSAYRMRELNKAMEVYFGEMNISDDPTKILEHYVVQRNIIVQDVKSRKALKRKAMADQELSEQSPNKRLKQGEQGTTTQVAISTQRSVSPVKQNIPSNREQSYINGIINTKAAVLDASQSNGSSMNATPSSLGRKRRAEDEIDPSRESKTRRFEGTREGSNTSNIFKKILDSPSVSTPAKSPTKVIAPLPGKANTETPRSNPFAALPIPTSPTKSTTPQPTSSFAFTPKSTSSVPSLATSQPNASTNSGFKVPTFGAGPVNWLSQFGQAAKKSAEDNEKELMKKAKEEDFDSEDDNEEEWEATYREKRRAQLEELENIAKQNKGGFVFNQAETPADKQVAAPQANLGLKSCPQGPSNGVSSPLNISRTSTPGPVTSASGSVFDGHTSGKPVQFSSNIFGHLSSESGADSGKSDNADEESGDETDPDADDDAENKDPNYKPEVETGSEPGTPVEETGAGIASAKKSNPFGSTRSGGLFSSLKSEATTPSGSGGLFNRINKDVNGNPIRQVSTEEKENTQPSAANIFGNSKNLFASLNKHSGAPADQTWKPDSPIRFGASPNTKDASDSTPTVNVTAATPTKSGSPAGIFGNLNNSNGQAPAPFANLFGSSSIAKSGVSAGAGFSFGGASNTSSLFPSATTSRATSPGATTDGSAAENDPDAEKHEQIDLTAGGPGEEDEEILHEVRAKAMIFVPKESGGSWATKGVGPLRVLKHKHTNAVRILLRADPSGTIVLNKAILPQMDYAPDKKTVKLTTATDNGNGFETWILQVKTPESATELARVLESNK